MSADSYDRTSADVPWEWWAGKDEEYFTIGPCATREQAIQEAVDDGICEWPVDGSDPEEWEHRIHLIEAQQAPLRLADWIDSDTVLERADESVADSFRVTEYDEGPWFEATAEQEADLAARLRRACDEWQAAHGLTFNAQSFSSVRATDFVVVPAGRSEMPAEGGDA